MEEGYQSFISVAAKEGIMDDIMELPRENDGTVLLSTVEAQFPSAVGLKYRSSSGGWRGIRAENNVLDPPHGGWGERIYIVTESDKLKRKSSGDGEYERPSRRTRREEDLIVLGVPYETTEDEVRDLFTQSCGELLRCELKVDFHTKKSKGFCFIQFKTEEAAKLALKGQHEIGGRRLEIRLSKKQGDNPMKLFVGKLPKGTTQDDVDEYFSEYGRLIDVFVPEPFRGCAFITYSAEEDAVKVLRRKHTFQGLPLKVVPARPKEGTSARRQENFGITKYNEEYYSSSGRRSPPLHIHNTRRYSERDSPYNRYKRTDRSNEYDRRSVEEPAAPAQKELASQLTDMFLTLIKSQGQK